MVKFYYVICTVCTEKKIVTLGKTQHIYTYPLKEVYKNTSVLDSQDRIFLKFDIIYILDLQVREVL